jgi:hypothetical protein
LSLGIVFNGPERIVLAADSRATLTAKRPGANEMVPATFDKTTQLLKASKQDYVVFVTYGVGAIGEKTRVQLTADLPPVVIPLVKQLP